jgi:hypothetical protein
MNVRTGYETMQFTDVPITQTPHRDPVWRPHSSTSSTALPMLKPTYRYNECASANTDMFGRGKLIGTALSVVDFVGSKGEYTGEAEGEFAFVGSGSIHALGTAIRNVPLHGLAQLSQGTAVLRRFDGHVVIDDRSEWWTPNVYRVCGALDTAVRRRARHHPPSRAYRAFKELGKWLELSDEELTKIVEFSRTTVSMTWQKGGEPRNKAKARRLYELHSVVSALHRTLGSGLAGWLKRGRPGPLKLLEQKEFERFERCADVVIFPTREAPRRRLDTARMPAKDDTHSTIETQVLRPAGRARSKRLAR